MQPNNQIPPQNVQGGDPNLYTPNPYATPQLAPASMLPDSAVMPMQKKTPVGLIIGLVVAILLFLTAVVMAVMFYTQMLDYKNNSDKKSAAAVALELEKQKKELDAQYAEQAKEPLTSYTSPAALGGVVINYPKTWSSYVDEKDSGGGGINAYFHPGFVPADEGGGDNKFNYALRAQIVQESYKQVTEQYAEKIKSGEATATPMTGLPGNSTGLRIDGQIEENVNGSVVIIPVRDKVLKIWTEGDQFKNDFNNFVLKNLKYNP